MRPLTLAFSFIRVPKLFVSLLFWPMVVGVAIALMQAVTSSAYFGLVTESADDYKERVMSDAVENQWLREKLFDSTKALPPIVVCRWETHGGVEQPPTAACAIEPYDVVIRAEDPARADISDYQQFFDGSTRKLHVCTRCSSDIILQKAFGETSSDVFGLQALGVYMLTDSASNSKVSNHYIDAKQTIEHLKDVSGTIYLHAYGAEQPINMTQATRTMILIINTSLITIIALWLSLKGHRKVLDYFARNGALLPLVAACGKNTFYTALWLITLFRVAFFLIAALPTTILVYARAVPDETLRQFMGDPMEFTLYIAGIVTSLSCLAIIASISELKQRHSWVSFLYRYIPLALCLAGTAIWFACVFTPGTGSHLLQTIISCLPVIGISPILISPLFSVDPNVIAAHCLISSIVVIMMLRMNSQWFAAHLEEI